VQGYQYNEKEFSKMELQKIFLFACCNVVDVTEIDPFLFQVPKLDLERDT